METTTTTLIHWINVIVVYMHIILFARIQALGCITPLSTCQWVSLLSIQVLGATYVPKGGSHQEAQY